MQRKYLEVRLESAHFPCDRLRVRKLEGREAISRLFDFELEAVALDRDSLDVEVMMGTDVAIVFEREGIELRRVRGMIAESEDLLDGRADFRTFRLRIVPRAFRLTMIETQEIFMDVTVPEIITRALKLVGLGKDLKHLLLGEYPKREFVVQYGETSFAFICRLAEHLGVSFYFKHQHGRERMVFTDHPAGFQTVEGLERAIFRERGEHRDVFDLAAKRRLIPSFYAVQDYNYRTPQVDLTSDHVIPAAYSGGIVEHGAHVKTPDEGKALAQIRAEERLSGQLVYEGKSDLCGLAAGVRTTLEGHPHLHALELLITEVTHHAVFVVVGSGDEAPIYSNTFRAIPGDRMYRPPRLTPKPRISGLVTGIVDPGLKGAEKYAQIDEQGRYTVRFLFDTAAPGERQASRPVRMLQNHSGEHYGTHFPLRPGAEVLIGFVNGDLDRPVIVGAVPNPTKPSPVTNRDEPGLHRIRTGSGVFIDIIDDV